MVETISALMIVVAAIFLLRIVAVRMGIGPPKGTTRSLTVLETAALSSRQRLCIVEAEGQRFLVGVSDVAGIRLIDRLPPGSNSN